MFPMLQGKNIKANDDHIIALKGIFMLSPLKKGDMIIFISPEDKQNFLVKRLVGEPGDEVYINMENNVPLQGWGSIPLRIPPNNYFVLGDNSKESRDSRMWGWLPGDYIVGKVYAICYPFYRTQIFNY